MDQKARANWEKTRADGLLKYVLINGLPWGLAMFFAMTFIANPDRSRGPMLYVSAVVWFIGGIVFGLGTWYFQERAYRKSGDP
jgi:hypothetical protein